METFNGIVLKERSFGDASKFIDVLTENGVIELAVNGVKKINSKSGSSAQLFAYSKFCASSKREQLYFNSAEPIRIFYGLRNSLSKIALASYFSEVIRFCIQEKSESKTVLRLLLNTLHFLEKDLRSEKLLKSIFELRLMSETGFMPDVISCRGCGVFEPQELFFGTVDGLFYCKDCFHDNYENYIKIKLPVLSAVRQIVLADFEKIYNLNLSDNTLERLSVLSEAYIISHLERSFNTLDFYKSVI